LFGIGGWEFLLIAALALLLFGPDKLPEFARTIGRLVRDFKRYQDLMESTIRAELYSTEPSKTPDAFKKGKEFRERVEAGEFEEEAEAEAEAEAEEAAPADEDAVAGPETGTGVDDLSADGGAEGAHRTGLPADHPLHDALEAGEDIGVDDDLDLSSVDEADFGWVPGRDANGEGGDGDEV
jgi:TatA/E family protein of Tat protein translocase